MKTCSYCGRQNADDQQYCGGCGTELTAEEAPPAARREEGKPIFVPTPAGPSPSTEPVDVSAIDMGCSEVEGFSRPDWVSIAKRVEECFPEEQRPQAWQEISKKWLAQLQKDLGGGYWCYESTEFLLLSAETEENCEVMLNFAEKALQTARSRLGRVAGRWKNGKPAILVFSEQDDYYSYISYYYPPEGHYSLSGGIFVRKGYGHIAFPFVDIYSARMTICHELTHDCLAHLRLPRWLNEGLCQGMEREIFRRGVVMDDELAKEHYAYWNETNIQEFWAGASFHQPGQGNRLSYSLAEVLTGVLSENWEDFLNFVEQSNPHDAGQDAALKCLNRSLGDVTADFLGPGEWRPNRKAIAELWSRKKEEKQ